MNISSLLLIRSDSRKRKGAVRSALGASRARLVQQFVTETCCAAGSSSRRARPRRFWRFSGPSSVGDRGERISPGVGGLWRGAWYRRYLQDVGSGQARVHSLLAAAAELGQRMSAADAAVLQHIGGRIAALVSRPEARELARLATSKSSAARRAFDQLAREGAKPLLVDVVDCLGTIEAMWSLAVATVEHTWSYPRPSSRLSVSGLFHPFLGDKAVPNDLHLDDRVRVCFVTGPNMAGKSTFLKAIAIAILLAHVGCGVPAASMDFPVAGTIFSSVQIVDAVSWDQRT